MFKKNEVSSVETLDDKIIGKTVECPTGHGPRNNDFDSKREESTATGTRPYFSRSITHAVQHIDHISQNLWGYLLVVFHPWILRLN